MYSYTTFEIKVNLCAHTDSKIGIFTRRVYTWYIFDSYPLPLFRRLTVGAAIEKIFFEFFFWIHYQLVLIILRFLFFLIFVWILVSTLFFRLSYLIISTRLKFVILYSILFFRLSIVSTRYKFCSIFTRLRFSYSLLNFYSHQFRLVSALQILHFDSLTLYLFCLL